MELPILKATQRLIDSVWTLSYQLIDGKILILDYNREDPDGYTKEKELPRMGKVETDKRIVTHIRLTPYKPFVYWADKDAETYEVINPKFVFSYSSK